MQDLKDEEDRLREKLRALSDEQRKQYYRLERERLKDPDTYAVLNYFLLPAYTTFIWAKPHVA